MLNRRVFAESLAQDAGVMARDYFVNRTALTVESKRPGDYVSEADRNVELMVRHRIEESYPDENVVGEEEGGTESGSFWCVDPIDGTSNFLAGIPIWGVSIAYCEGGVPMVGAIAIPMQDILISADMMQPGFYLNGVHHSKTADTPIDFLALGESQDWTRDAIRQVEDVFLGAGLTLVKYRCCVVGLVYAALGRTRGYFEQNTNIWDVSAGYVIAKQAGLEVSIKRNTSGHQLRISALHPAEHDAVKRQLHL